MSIEPIEVLGWTPVNGPRQRIAVFSEADIDLSTPHSPHSPPILKGKGRKKRARVTAPNKTLQANLTVTRKQNAVTDAITIQSPKKALYQQPVANYSPESTVSSARQSAVAYNTKENEKALMQTDGHISKTWAADTFDETFDEAFDDILETEFSGWESLHLPDSSIDHCSSDEYGSLDDQDLNELDMIVSGRLGIPTLFAANFAHQPQLSSNAMVTSSAEEAVKHMTLLEIDNQHVIGEISEREVSWNKEILRPTTAETNAKDKSIVMRQGVDRNGSSAGNMPFKRSFKRQPIVRNSPPQPVQNYSPILGISSTSYLRTCFRIGEAINFGNNAMRKNQDVFVELYARVASSSRENPPGFEQHFKLWDIYHDRPPYLSGYYNLWNQCEMWETESRAFISRSEKKMCRCVGKMTKMNGDVLLVILNIWEAAWEDVDYVKGIVDV